MVVVTVSGAGHDEMLAKQLALTKAELVLAKGTIATQAEEKQTLIDKVATLTEENAMLKSLQPTNDKVETQLPTKEPVTRAPIKLKPSDDYYCDCGAKPIRYDSRHKHKGTQKHADNLAKKIAYDRGCKSYKPNLAKCASQVVKVTA